ncbi:MAG TPA: CsgG/HfaB family protein [Bacteroidota bacterium]|nr:CsgG/HfaB family protein [Bacteroidota bacterium]
MRARSIIVTILAGGILASCSSVKPPTTSALPEKQPQASRTNTQAGERSLKRKVAIARFSNETKYGQGFFYDQNDDRLGKQAMDIFSAKLAATEKFIMLERADLAHLTKEKEIGNLGSLNIAADYLILGSVSEFGRKTTSDVGVFSRTKKQTAYAKVSVRLVDVATSQIVYSEEGDGEAYSEAETVLGVGSTAEYDASLNDKVISAAIAKLVNNITEHLLNKPWRSYLLSFEEGTYVIAGGPMQGIREGDQFTVYRRGKRAVNPQTNVEIELPGRPVGKIGVTTVVPGDVNTEVSMCTKISGDLPTAGFTEFYIQEH